MTRRKDDLSRPEHLTAEQWVARLLSDRRLILAQTRREVHTRGNCHQRMLDRIDRALLVARSQVPSYEPGEPR